MVGERDPKFYSELKQTNEDLLSILKATHEKSPYFDFSPTVLDYVKQIDDLLKQYPEKTTNAASTISASITTNNNGANTTSLASKGNLFSSASPFNPSTTFSLVPPSSGSTGPTFGNSQTPASQPFLFGNAQAPILVPTTTSTTSSTSFFSFTLPKKDEPATVNSTTNNDASTADAATGDDDAPPPAPNVDKYEEPDSKYSVKCKVYEKGKPPSSVVTTIGIGILYVKALETPNKLQVIFRQEPDLRRVALNEVITPEIPVKKLPNHLNGPRAIQMIFPNKSGDNKIYIIKLKDEHEATALLDMLTFQKS